MYTLSNFMGSVNFRTIAPFTYLYHNMVMEGRRWNQILFLLYIQDF